MYICVLSASSWVGSDSVQEDGYLGRWRCRVLSRGVGLSES